MRIEIELAPSQSDEDVLSHGIMGFNDEAIDGLEPVDVEQRFHVMARDTAGVLQGGIRATCYWNTLHIELLWLSEDARGSGVGRKLIDQAEAFAVKNNCENAFVETTSWQAKPFYEKSGYRLMATLHNRPKGHSTHYLSKLLV